MGTGRRIVKIVLIAIGALVGLVILVIAGLLIYQSIDKEDSFVLENAEFQEVGYLRRLDSMERPRIRQRDEPFPVYAHRLKRGSGSVFAWRFYSNGNVNTIDDEVYRKVTLWIAGPPPASPTNISLGDESKAVLIWCNGGSAWPGHECCGYGTSGAVSIAPSSRGFTIAIDADITPAGSGDSKCDSERVNRSFQARTIGFDDLTPWLGIAGRHPYHETYRWVK